MDDSVDAHADSLQFGCGSAALDICYQGLLFALKIAQ
jgi:hypothetical protein